MSKYKNLINNSLVFAIGSFGSKFINLIMVPLYTYVLSTVEYGTVDLMTTTINLLVPFITVTIEQALIRFIMNKKKDYRDDEVLTSSLFFCFFSSLISIVFFSFIFNFFNIYTGYRVYFILLVVLTGFQNILLQFSRGIGKIKEFALNGIIQTIIVAALNVILLFQIRMGIEGYLLSNLISIVISIIYLFYVIEGWKRISLNKININLLKNLLRYSTPLLPNSTMWWLVNNSTRYIILIFVGASGNGLFAVANKIPSIITMFTSIFQQAWQLSAYEEYETNDKEVYFSEVFRKYYQFLFTIGSALLVVCRPIIKYFVNGEYYDSWMIIPALILAVIYQTFSGFMGTIYTASMKTRNVFTTSIIGAAISVVANLILIPFFGVIGAGFGTALAFFIMWLIRLIETRKIIYTRINMNEFLLNNFIFLFQIIFLYLLKNSHFVIIFCVEIFFLASLFIVNRSLFSWILANRTKK